MNKKAIMHYFKEQLSNLYALGYKEIPKDIECVILAKIQHRESGSILKDQTPNPFKAIKAKQRYATLSNGLFDELHEAVDSIQYYHALLNTKTKKIIQLLPIETNDDYKVDPVVFALSVDPLADKYPNVSPYAYCTWNPVVYVDPNGMSKTWYVDEANNVIMHTHEGSNDVVTIPNKDLADFKYNADAYKQNKMSDYYDCNAWNDYNKTKYGLSSRQLTSNEIAILGFCHSENSREKEVQYLLNPTLSNQIAFGFAEAGAQWTDPMMLVAAMTLGVCAIESYANATTANIVEYAAIGSGNFGLGTVSYEEAMTAGKRWVGEGYRISSNGKAWISANGTRQFRPPSIKTKSGFYQANFQSRFSSSGEWINNGHLNIR